MTESKQSSKKVINYGQFSLLALIAFSFIWYLLADRYTPYTTQSRVQSYVVGVGSEVSGPITKIYVKNNQQVEEGQVLFEIDPAQYEIALNKAKSNLETAKQQLDAGNSAVVAAKANLKAAQANGLKAKQDAARLEKLHKEDAGTISVRRLEAARATLQQAKASVTAAQASVQRAISSKGGEDDAENAKLKAAKSAVDKAQLDLENTVIRASSHGIITDLRAEVGQFSGAGAAMMTLVSVNDVWINAEFTENNLGHMLVNDKVEILFDSIPGHIYTGSIRSIGLGVSAGNPPSPGVLPTIKNNRDWLRQAQRFPVIITIDESQSEEITPHIRIGGQTSIIAYSQDSYFLRGLGMLYIRVMSVFSYVY